MAALLFPGHVLTWPGAAVCTSATPLRTVLTETPAAYAALRMDSPQSSAAITNWVAGLASKALGRSVDPEDRPTCTPCAATRCISGFIGDGHKGLVVVHAVGEPHTQPLF